ncbi:hypothetical protein RHMOL_Rhmol12G0083700 [Rhododendron molle]|uniref:Uncharacterized protein n=1 Tax=Rhododendron molle TaxID=49168 RepID=A0ACC0LG95_RHOML|nr:hypothetical protein RHMOL_Rhmol12G0083700 [Rhododendron molle]
MPRLNITEIRRREAEEAFITLNMYIRAAMDVFRLYCFIVSTAHYPRPELSPNPNYYQTQVDAVNRLVNAMDNTQQGNMPTRKAAKTRRSWRKTEEDTLMKYMVTKISEKWRAENEFKPGFFTVLEKEMENVMPESKIKASPHIDSKVKYWRQTYAKITDILKLSGFGWDHVNKRIEVDDEVWKIYEEDRANEDGSEVPSEMARAAENENVMPNEGIEENEDCYYPILGEEFHRTPTSGLTGMSDEIPLGSTPPLSTPTVSVTSNSARRMSLPMSTPRTSTPPASAGTQKGKKRTRMGDVGSLATSMEVWLEKSDSHMEKMSDAMGYSNKLSARRSQVPLELEKLDLTDTQRFRLGVIICATKESLDLFYGIKEHKKQAWVEVVLDGIIFGPI